MSTAQGVQILLFIALSAAAVALAAGDSPAEIVKELEYDGLAVTRINFDLEPLTLSAALNQSIAMKIQTTFPVDFQFGTPQEMLLASIAPVVHQEIVLDIAAFEYLLNPKSFHMVISMNEITPGSVAFRLTDRAIEDDEEAKEESFDFDEEPEKCNLRLLPIMPEWYEETLEIFDYIDCRTKYPGTLSARLPDHDDNDEYNYQDDEIDETEEVDGEVDIDDKMEKKDAKGGNGEENDDSENTVLTFLVLIVVTIYSFLAPFFVLNF